MEAGFRRSHQSVVGRSRKGWPNEPLSSPSRARSCGDHTYSGLLFEIGRSAPLAVDDDQSAAQCGPTRHPDRRTRSPTAMILWRRDGRSDATCGWRRHGEHGVGAVERSPFGRNWGKSRRKYVTYIHPQEPPGLCSASARAKTQGQDDRTNNFDCSWSYTMINHVRRQFSENTRYIDAIDSEITSNNNLTNRQLSPKDILEYIRSMMRELADLALQCNTPFLAYLLSMAAQEADDSYKAAGPQLRLVGRGRQS
jgi:hypothetical protein